MNIERTFRLSIKNILSSKGRSLLTMLGIIIGVAAVIVIVGLGNGMETYMKESFQSMGTNLLTVNVIGRGSARSVSVDDMYHIADENSDLFVAMSPTVSVSATIKVGSEVLEDTQATGVGEDYLSMKKFTMENGRFIQYADNLSRSKVCVIGSFIAQEWFSGNALGESIKINGNYYEIVGVLNEISDSTEGSSDDCVYLPYTTGAKAMGTGTITSFSFEMASEDNVQESKDAIESALYEVFGSTDAYMIISLSEMLDTMTSMVNIVVTILALIAGISLVVGGVGIMNIMLVSVSERTREIGIRKALGAKRRDVLFQFVLEAGITSALGGVIGILIGYLLSSAGTILISVMLSEGVKIVPSIASVMIAFGISAGIGVVFGYLPAKKAAQLNPIDALRYE